MNNYKLLTIGCGDAFASGGRRNTSFFIETPELNYLVDCGATTLLGMKEMNISTDEIDVICITHFHGDHYGGIPFLILDMAQYRKRKKRLTIISPPGGKKKMKELMSQLYPGGDKFFNALDIDYKEFKNKNGINTKGMTLKSFPVVHTKASLPHGLRFEFENKIFAYSGDTEWTDELIPLCENADLFICECNYTDPGKGHLDYATLIKKKGELNAEKIYLTHLGEEMLVKKDLDVPVLEDGMEILF